MSAVSSPVHDEDEVRIKEETRFSFVQDIQRQADRVAKGLILKEQDYNSPKVSRKPRFVDDAAWTIIVESSRLLALVLLSTGVCLVAL